MSTTHSFGRTAYKVAIVGAVIGAAFAFSTKRAAADEYPNWSCGLWGLSCIPGLHTYCSIDCGPMRCTCTVNEE